MKKHTVKARLKQVLIASLCLTVFLFGFSGCKKAADNGPASAAEPASASSSQNELYLPLCSDTEGMYSAEYDYVSSRWLLRYIDYDSCKNLPLCSAPNCAHNSDSCTAWVPPHSAAASPYVLKNDQIVFFIQSSETEEETLYIADKDGSNRRVLLTGLAGAGNFFPFFQNQTFLADDSFLYFMLYKVNEDSSFAYTLCRVPLTGGDMEEVCSLDDSNQYLGTLGRELILSRVHYQNEPKKPELPENISFDDQLRIDEDYHEKWNKETIIETELCFKNMDTGEERFLCNRQDSPGSDPVFYWNNDRMWWYASNCPQSLHWLTPAGEEGEVSIQWPQEWKERTAWYARPILYVQDHLIVDLQSQDDFDSTCRFALNSSDGTATLLTLSQLSNGREIPLQILACLPDCMLVQICDIVGQIAQTDKSGLPYIQETYEPLLGLISYEDYFSSTPNYREIKTVSES